MKERFYAGLALAKDLQFCAYMDELRAHPGVLILNEGERALVHEMEYKDDGRIVTDERVDTGRTHEGYASHYVTFLFDDMIFYMQAGTHYPFTDENEPGMFNFVPYVVQSPTTRTQSGYYTAYTGIDSLDNAPVRPLPQALPRPIVWDAYSKYEWQIANLVRTHGGVREKSIWNNGRYCIMLKGHTWNDEHKVMQVISLIVDHDGHRDSFDVDLVCGKICG